MTRNKKRTNRQLVDIPLAAENHEARYLGGAEELFGDNQPWLTGQAYLLVREMEAACYYGDRSGEVPESHQMRRIGELANQLESILYRDHCRVTKAVRR